MYRETTAQKVTEFPVLFEGLEVWIDGGRGMQALFDQQAT